MNPRGLHVRRLGLLVTLCTACLFLLSPWPGPQETFHVFIVLGLAPVARTHFACALFAGTAGWVVEAALRAYPVMGGTALGNMVCAVLLWHSLSISPPAKPFNYYLQLLLALSLHTVLVHLAVTAASGSHAMGYGWQWSFVLFPLWGLLAWRLYTPPHQR